MAFGGVGRPDRKGFDIIMYQQHQDRLKNMKSTVDSGPPRPHPLSNKSEMEKRRHFLSIEFDNKLLLERLAKIVQKTTLDNQVHHSVEMHQKFKDKMRVTKKRVQMMKITDENQRLLRRIQEVPPAYNHLEWEEQAKEREHIIRTMALYPEYYEKLDKEREKEKIKKEQEKLTKQRSTSALPSITMNNRFSSPGSQSQSKFSH